MPTRKKRPETKMLTSTASEILPDLPLPLGLSFDGILPGTAWLQFTEHDEKSPSYKASFYVDLNAAILESVLRRRAEKRDQFARAFKAPKAVSNGEAVGQ